VEKILQVPKNLELMAVIALGYPDEEKRQSSRKQLEECIVARK
jgi:hypothetical protein